MAKNTKEMEYNSLASTENVFMLPVIAAVWGLL